RKVETSQIDRNLFFRRLWADPTSIEEEEEDEQVFELERKTSSFHHGSTKRPNSAESSTITTTSTSSSSSSSSFSGDVNVIPDFINGQGERVSIENLEVPESPEHGDGNDCNVFFDGEQGLWKCRHCDWTYREESLFCFETKGQSSLKSAGAESEAHESQTVQYLNGERTSGSAFEDNQGSREIEEVQDGAELQAHDSQTVGHLNGEKKPSESASEDNQGSREIEEVQDGDLPKELDEVDQPTGDAIEEELEIGDVEDYDVEKVLDNQETHDLFCPNCNSCITKRVVLKRRKRKIHHELDDPKRLRGPEQSAPLLHSEDNLASADDGENSRQESFVFKCLSCFSIFIPTGILHRNDFLGTKILDSKPSVSKAFFHVQMFWNIFAGVGSKPLPARGPVDELKTQPKPQEEVAGDSNWFNSIFGFGKKRPAVQQGGAMSSVPEANLPRDNMNLTSENTTGSTVNTPAEAKALVQNGAPTSTQVANSNDTGKVVNNGATVEDGKKVLAPLAEEEQTQQKIDKYDGNHSSDKGRLSPIQPSREMNISNTVTSGPDGVRVETIFHSEGVSHVFEGTDSSETRMPDYGLTKVTGVMDTGDIGVITNLPSSGIDIPPLPVSSLEEGTLTEPLLRPVIGRSFVEGRKVEILKSIVYGGLVESITSLGVISSAAGSGASTLNILVLGLANLFGGLILIIHNKLTEKVHLQLQELRDEEPRRTTTEDNQTNSQVAEGRYKRLLGQRENFTLHAAVVILSFIIAGLLPPIVYYFSFSKTHNRDYRVASVFGASLLCIVLLALAKAHVRNPRSSHFKSVLYYTMIAVSVSGISYMVGKFLDHLLEKYGWSDGSETPAGQMMLSLMGRKAGSFGYSSAYRN
ncbi:unnamed protein product, partial [Cochlearia groenlandica]